VWGVGFGVEAATAFCGAENRALAFV